MHLVYRAMEKEPVPTSLPNSLIPPSKRKKTAGALPGAVAVLPSVPGFMAGPGSRKESLRSTPPLYNAPLLSTSTVNISPKHSFRSSSEVCCCTNSLIIFLLLCILVVLYILIHRGNYSHPLLLTTTTTTSTTIIIPDTVYYYTVSVQLGFNP